MASSDTAMCAATPKAVYKRLTTGNLEKVGEEAAGVMFQAPAPEEAAPAPEEAAPAPEEATPVSEEAAPVSEEAAPKEAALAPEETAPSKGWWPFGNSNTTQQLATVGQP